MPTFSRYTQSPIPPQLIHDVLETDFLYYKNLNPALKQRFIQRISIFIREKKFVARQGLELNPRIRIIVSACAIQITFGLDSYLLDNFESIIIYPDIYESPITKQLHKGETNLNGFICLSWKHIIEGIENPNDNYNLGIHEWMHALRFNGINYEQTDYFFDGYINKWVAGAMPEYNKLRVGVKKSIFRRYGATNIHEFLSVCTEHFFESPDEFEREAPEFFEEMCILLNQKPSKTGSTQLGVRYSLLNKTSKSPINQNPILTFEASFFRTLINFGIRLMFLVMAIITLLSIQNPIAYLFLVLVLLMATIKMNNMYFTIKFYDDFVYVQKGFASRFSTQLSIPYRCLMKMEIFDGNFDNYSTGTVFQFNYFNGDTFSKKIAYCSAIDVPKQKVMDVLSTRKVTILWPL